jgi:hypothetical protein
MPPESRLLTCDKPDRLTGVSQSPTNADSTWTWIALAGCHARSVMRIAVLGIVSFGAPTTVRRRVAAVRDVAT